MNSFRDFEKSLCILRDRACINILDPDQASGANGILFYGYVDHATGLTLSSPIIRLHNTQGVLLPAFGPLV